MSLCPLVWAGGFFRMSAARHEQRLIRLHPFHLSRAIRGVRVSGLRMVDRKTTLVTNAGSTSNSTARTVVTT